jgi:hypothetical protein
MGRLSASSYLVFFLSVCWLEKLMLSHGAFVVVIEKSCNVCDVWS